MGLILCEGLEAKSPLYIEDLDINIYSLEELAYLIYDNPILVMENFIDEKLFWFISESLSLNNLSTWLLKMYRDKKLNDDILYYILESSGFYNKKEIIKYRREIEGLRALPKEEYLKKQADYMFSLKKYAKAIEIFERILVLINSKSRKIDFLGSIYNNLAASYANMFKFDNAYMNYRLAYECLQDKNILKKLVYLEKLGAKPLEDVDRLISFENNEVWSNEFETKKKEVLNSDDIKDFKAVFKYDSVKKAAIIRNKIEGLRHEYRTMI